MGRHLHEVLPSRRSPMGFSGVLRTPSDLHAQCPRPTSTPLVGALTRERDRTRHTWMNNPYLQISKETQTSRGRGKHKAKAQSGSYMHRDVSGVLCGARVAVHAHR